MAEMDELCKRTWAAIDELEACVKEEKDEDEDAEYHTRVSTVGMTMVGLGLGLSALGDLALYLVEVDKILEESDKEQSSKDDSEWPETVG